MTRWSILFVCGVSSFFQPIAFSQEQTVARDVEVVSSEQLVSEQEPILEEIEENLAPSDSSTPQDLVNLGANHADLRIGFINFRRIMASIPQLQSVSSTLDREFAQQTAALSSKQQDLSEMEKILSNMNRGDAYSDYEKQVIAKRRDYVREEAAYRDAYSVRRNEELAKLQRIVVDEIVAIAKESNYDVILNDTGVIYVSEEADLTTTVIDRLRGVGE